MTDSAFMRHALVLAARALGRVAPNPAVGCVIVSPDGQVVGRGATQSGGRPHAEVIALSQAGKNAKHATAFVTLEPCAHHGETPPCAHALIRAGIGRVVVATTDPDPRVNGSGIRILREAGISVDVGVLKNDVIRLNQGFFSKVLQSRPLVTLKVAQSLDGHTASASGESKWITGAKSRRFGHLLRARHDAILVGIETVIADDPDLTCRVEGMAAHSPIRVVLDSKLRLSTQSKLALTAKQVPTLVFTTSSTGAPLEAMGVQIIRVEPNSSSQVGIPLVLKELAARGLTRLLVEGGATIHSAFLNAGLVDRLEVFTAPIVLGADGRNAIGVLTGRKLDEAPNFIRINSRSLNEDRLESYAVRT